MLPHLLSGLPVYSGLKWDQFNCGLWGASGAKGAFSIKGLRGSRAFWFGGGFDLALDFDFDSGFD